MAHLLLAAVVATAVPSDPAVVWAWTNPLPPAVLAPQTLKYPTYAQGVEKARTSGLLLVTFVGTAKPSLVPGVVVCYEPSLPPFPDGVVFSRWGANPVTGAHGHWHVAGPYRPDIAPDALREMVKPGSPPVPPPNEVKAEVRPRPRVTRFTAVWCGPCRAFAPVFEGWAARFAGDADFRTVDVDDDRAEAARRGGEAEAARLGVDRVPTVVVERGGAVVGRLTGSSTEANLLPLIRSAP